MELNLVVDDDLGDQDIAQIHVPEVEFELPRHQENILRQRYGEILGRIPIARQNYLQLRARVNEIVNNVNAV